MLVGNSDTIHQVVGKFCQKNRLLLILVQIIYYASINVTHVETKVLNTMLTRISRYILASVVQQFKIKLRARTSHFLPRLFTLIFIFIPAESPIVSTTTRRIEEPETKISKKITRITYNIPNTHLSTSQKENSATRCCFRNNRVEECKATLLLLTIGSRTLTYLMKVSIVSFCDQP